MKAQIMSDLHTEFHLKPVDFLRSLIWEPALDFLLLPGDIVVANAQPLNQIREVFDFLASKARYVVYTVGNHEYYHSENFTQVEEKLKGVMPSNFIWLENGETTLDGVHFFGGCMWFGDPDGLNVIYKKLVNDFSLIKDWSDWVYVRNCQYSEKARQLVRSDTVVLSHHLCTPESTPRHYRDDPANRFFLCDQTKLILEKQPHFWVHGHTHNGCRYAAGKTQVIANPYGYPHERKFFPNYRPVILEL